jgi:hypothetical protein
MCKNGCMPQTPQNIAQPEPSFYPLVINFGDDATLWFREIAAVIQANPPEIHVQFIGGSSLPPFEIIALRNALLEIPSHIKLVTTAISALPPFACAAWLVGDERRIARDALVWIPKLPEELLRNGLSGSTPFWNPTESEEDAEGEEESDPLQPLLFQSSPHERPSRRKTSPRMEMDLRVLANAINEWFPTWEFNGKYLDFDDLVDWEVVKPEWGFGGKNVRTRPYTGKVRNPEGAPAPEPPQRSSKKKETETTPSAETGMEEGVARIKTGNLPPENE